VSLKNYRMPLQHYQEFKVAERKPIGFEVTASDQLEADMEELWHITASEEKMCEECIHFEEECCANHAEMCPRVIKFFNLDGITFQ